MNHVTLLRNESAPTYTRGILFVGDRRYAVIERPWLDNRPNISCIPPGQYHCDYLARSASGKYRDVYWLRRVPGRSGVLIHQGNLAAHSRGCLIIGSRKGRLGGQAAVLASRTALADFVESLDRQPFTLTITRGDQHD